MKTITLSIAFILCFIKGTSQNELAANHTTNYNLESEPVYTQGKLQPVYFNLGRRQLKNYQKHPIQPLDFLYVCRSINDSAVQLQVARYDSFTKDKQRLGVIALGGGFSAIGLLGSAAASTSGGQANDVMITSMAFFGAIALLAIPATAIYSAVPHQKRKTVLFRDLPIAYNQYVQSHR